MFGFAKRRRFGRESDSTGRASSVPAASVAYVHAVLFKGKNEFRPFFNFKRTNAINGHGVQCHGAILADRRAEVFDSAASWSSIFLKSGWTGKSERMINENRLVKLFLDLCQFNAPSLAEAEIVAWTKKHLIELGLEVWEDSAAERLGGTANNLIAKLPATMSGLPRIFFSAHFDTVEPTDRLVISEIDGVFVSDGTTILGADDRAGIAPAIEAVRSVIEDQEPHGDIYLLFSVAEEIGLLGASVMDFDQVEVDYGFVLDTGPPVGTFVNQTATHDKLTVQIFGKPAHAGKEPEKGINAIQVAAAAIQGMSLGRISAVTTANIGSIEGGTATNVVCAEVTLRAEARSLDIEELDQQIEHMRSRFSAAAAAAGAQVTFEHHRHYTSFLLDESEPVVQKAQAASRAMGFEPVLRHTLGGSDANIFNARGIPAVVVATGMDKIHTHEERISRIDLVNTAKLAVEIIRQCSCR